VVLAAFIFVIAGPVGAAHAVSSYMTTFNSTYASAPAAVKSCNVCHPNYPSSTSRNSYGTAFASNGRNYAAIANLDSDGDGFTNIVEINAGKFPGDATSKPAVTTPEVASATINAPVAGTLHTNAVKLDLLTTGNGATVYLDGQPTSYVTGSQVAGLSNGNHTLRVDATDALGGMATTEVVFTVAVEPLAVAALTKMPGKGSSAVASLYLDYASGSYFVQIVNSRNWSVANTIDFGAANTPVALSSTPDLDGNGKLEVAVLATDGTGNALAVIKDSATGADVKTLTLAEIATPIALTAGDIDGDGAPELCVLGTAAGGNPVVVVYDLAAGTLVNTVLCPAGMTARSLALVADASGNSVAELAVLGVLAGQGQYLLLDAASGATVATKLLSATLTPLALASFADINGNGADELAVVGVYLNGKVKALAYDSFTGKKVGSLIYSAKYIPQGIAAINDANGNGVPEIGVLGLHAAGQLKVNFSDISTGAAAGLVKLPNRQM
jgi:hypothetical protein